MIDKDKMIEELRGISTEIFGDGEYVCNALCLQLILLVWKKVITVEEAKVCVRINEEDSKIIEARELSKELEDIEKNSKVIEIEDGEIVEDKPEE